MDYEHIYIYDPEEEENKVWRSLIGGEYENPFRNEPNSYAQIFADFMNEKPYRTKKDYLGISISL